MEMCPYGYEMHWNSQKDYNMLLYIQLPQKFFQGLSNAIQLR